jgi:flavin reductase (DIM6/NTAB) family NADH-FMN oxidoreductase RutF
MVLEYSELGLKERYQLMAQTAVPRPIAWIVTEAEGVVNIAPFSYFTPLSSNPPTLVVSIGHKPDGTPKDTLSNIRQERCCTICMVKPEQMRQMHFSSKVLDHAVSEAEEFHIPLRKVAENFPPMVDGSPVAFFSEFYEEVELRGSKTVPLILSVTKQYIDDECIKDAEEFYLQCDLLARIGREYGRIGMTFPAPEIP